MLVSGLIMTAVAMIYVCALCHYALATNRRVSELAQLDALTSLANRRAFVARLDAAFAASRAGANPFAVLCFDLDQFKDINETLGHPAGDQLLQQVAERLRGAVRGKDLVARFGGDEFAVLQSDLADPATAGKLAVRVGELLGAPYTVGGHVVRVTASIGISCYAPDLDGPEAMLMQADVALYRAKEDGRNCYRFHSADFDRQVQERVTIADELRGAHERGELELHYQPQVELASGRIVGLEALLRWNHPKRGLIPPSIFIPIAERAGCIQAIGFWVFDAACRQLKLWQEQHIAPALMAVNFSALQFKGSSDLEQEIVETLAKWGVAPGLMEIELTESVLMDVTRQHSDRFERLRQLGLRIAIDDFGTGYSSLSYLTTYPVDRLKIARELVFRVDTDSRNAAVVRTVIRLAQELGIDVVAEGVETLAQAKFLVAAGCAHAQGYHFSRPVNAEHATELLRRGIVRPARDSLRVVGATAA